MMPMMDDEPGVESGPRYASALSEHPDPADAAAEVTAQILERLGPEPELAVLFVTPPHRDAAGEIADVVRAVLRPSTLLGAAAVAVLGPGREVEQTPGVTLFAARLGSPPIPVRLGAESTPDGWQISGGPPRSTGWLPSSHAEPASHGLGMIKAPSRSCSALNSSAFSFCVVVMSMKPSQSTSTGTDCRPLMAHIAPGPSRPTGADRPSSARGDAPSD